MIRSVLAIALLALALPIGVPALGDAAFPVATPVGGMLGETPGDVPVSLLIENRGASADWLLGGSTPIARRVEVRRSRLEHGVRVMLTEQEGIQIPGNAIRILEPERDHLMLIGLRQDLVQGDSFPLTLHFARAGDVTVTGRVRRKVDAAGVALPPPATSGAIVVSLVSAPPAPAAT